MVNAILFNHDSFIRDNKFLFKYLFNSCLNIKKNKIKKIKIKDSRPVRDFGCAKDFVSYFYRLMQIKKSGNFVVATGKSYSVKQIVNIYKKKFNLSKDVIEFKNNFDFNNLHKIIKFLTACNQVLEVLPVVEFDGEDDYLESELTSIFATFL